MMTTMLSSASILVSLIRSGAVTVTDLMVHISAEGKRKNGSWEYPKSDGLESKYD